MAWDSVYPYRRAATSVLFTIPRNPNSPVFSSGGSYVVSVNEGVALGYVVTRIQATDNDGVSPQCFLMSVSLPPWVLRHLL